MEQEVMTPEQFAEKMRDLYNDSYNRKAMGVVEAHEKADALMCELLRSLGYGEGVEIFEAADKWYA